MHINNGYECVYLPHNPSARQNGYVYKHRLLMEEKLGRRLKRCEHVHHKDGDRLNNSLDNLELTTNKGHAHKHKGKKRKRSCFVCGAETYNRKFCSQECSHMDQRKVLNRPSKKFLEEAVWEQTIPSLARDFGVSDGTIRKWCRLCGIVDLPPRGYWQKRWAGKL